MRIAIFSEVYWPMVSGVGVTLVRLVDALARLGHELRVYSATYALPPGEPERPEAHRSPGVPLFLYPDVHWAFPRRRAITEDLRRFEPDVVHVATEFSMGLAGMKAARELGLPVVASAHTDYQKYANRYRVEWVVQMGWMYLRWFYGHSHRVLVPSSFFERVLNGRGIHHTAIWTRGVDTSVFSPAHRSASWRARFGVGPDDMLVTYVGRLAREKDLIRLLEAWAGLPGRPANAQLVLVGQGPLEAEIRRRGLPGVH
ncbi:MAG: glycosyltransferase, partial [Gemmatimonadota bacterium]|nr:glycosyltransferase [Gemmatimonadota bacterium]